MEEENSAPVIFFETPLHTKETVNAQKIQGVTLDSPRFLPDAPTPS